MQEIGYMSRNLEQSGLQSIEICAGAGGQALGLEQAGFRHAALVEIDPHACATLRANRPHWNIIEGDVKAFSAKPYYAIDLLAGGVPCPPFSVAGKQLGKDDERDLFPDAIRLVGECCPKAIMLENVRGLFFKKFDSYRAAIVQELHKMGYACFWNLVEANQYGVPQRRTRTVLVALKNEYANFYTWPLGSVSPPPDVGQLLFTEMQKHGWEGAAAWAKKAAGIAPTIVGGSKKHGGPDLGPTRARQAWEKLGVDGRGIADDAPMPGFVGAPRLTVKMVGLLQGFPAEWEFAGKKTAAYKQVGNAFPPPVARAIAVSIQEALYKGAAHAVEKRAV
jgi:DNA (cytosine-5)-methyltransferase 1